MDVVKVERGRQNIYLLWKAGWFMNMEFIEHEEGIEVTELWATNASSDTGTNALRLFTGDDDFGNISDHTGRHCVFLGRASCGGSRERLCC